MFFSRKRKASGKVRAPLSGIAIPITEIDDAVFAAKILGDGVALIPTSGEVVAPFDGLVVNVADTYHALGLRAADGMELLIHVGIDTVELNGGPFTSHVKAGDKVKCGQLLLEVDLQAVTAAGYELQTPVIVTNLNESKSYTIRIGEAIAGKTCIIEYEM